MKRRLRRGWCGTIFALLVCAGITAAADQGLIHGAMIRQAKIGGFFLHYHLLTWKERDLLMQGMGTDLPGVDRTGQATHHLLMYLGSAGKSIPSAKVEFRITAPDGSVQATPTMAMQGGYGADVALALKGAYRIEMKAEIGTATLRDELAYAVK